MAPIIETVGLTKEYFTFFGDKVLALDNLDLAIEQGEIFGFLGPNGAGKTTTIKLLLGLIFPSKGTAFVNGHKVPSVKARSGIGYMPEGTYFHEFLRGEEILQFYGKLYGYTGHELKERVDRSLNTVGMTDAKRMMLKHYSHGMRQRIGLAQALLSDPDLLILDEPTVGLDPIARREIRDILYRLGQAGKTLFLCSHELSEVEQICSHVIILNRGKVVTEGKLLDLMYSDIRWVVRAVRVPDALFERLQSDKSTQTTRELGDTVCIEIACDPALRNRVVQDLEGAGGEVLSIQPTKMTLEDLFISAVKKAS